MTVQFNILKLMHGHDGWKELNGLPPVTRKSNTLTRHVAHMGWVQVEDFLPLALKLPTGRMDTLVISTLKANWLVSRYADNMQYKFERKDPLIIYEHIYDIQKCFEYQSKQKERIMIHSALKLIQINANKAMKLSSFYSLVISF